MDKKKKSLTKYYQSYDNFVKKYYPEFQESWQILEKLGDKAIKPDRIILNIGAGHSSRLEKYFLSAKKVYGLDPDMKALSKNKYINHKIIGKAESIPLPNASVDIIILEWVIEHIKDPQKAFNEISRVLKPNGKIIFCTPNIVNPVIFLLSFPKKLSNSLSQIIIAKALLDRDKEDVYPIYYHANTLKKIKIILNRAGLEIIDLRTTGCPGYFRFWKPLLWLSLCWERILSRPSFKWAEAYLLGIAQKI